MRKSKRKSKEPRIRVVPFRPRFTIVVEIFHDSLIDTRLGKEIISIGYNDLRGVINFLEKLKSKNAE